MSLITFHFIRVMESFHLNSASYSKAEENRTINNIKNKLRKWRVAENKRVRGREKSRQAMAGKQAGRRKK